MSAREEIARLLDQWAELSQAEGCAIQLAEWQKLKKIQADKAALQRLLTEARQKFDREPEANLSATPSLKPAEHPFHQALAQLISLQNRNADLMAAQVKRARAEQEALEQAQRNLRRLQNSYASPTARAAWVSYS